MVLARVKTVRELGQKRGTKTLAMCANDWLVTICFLWRVSMSSNKCAL